MFFHGFLMYQKLGIRIVSRVVTGEIDADSVTYGNGADMASQ